MLFPPQNERPRAYRVTRWLLVGPALGANAGDELADQGVTRILDLRAEGPAGTGVLPAGIECRRFPIIDGKAPSFEQFEQIAGWVRPAIDGEGAVYVHCQGGLGRSPTVSIALLMSTGLPLREAIRLVVAARPGASPTEDQLAWLRELNHRMSEDSQLSAPAE